jgi:hypothetical protein
VLYITATLIFSKENKGVFMQQAVVDKNLLSSEIHPQQINHLKVAAWVAASKKRAIQY